MDIQANRGKKIYIAGKITGLPEEEYKSKFKHAESILKAQGYTVINPTILPLGLEHRQYLHINFAMIDVCDEVYLLDNWRDSPGAKEEYAYAVGMGKALKFQ